HRIDLQSTPAQPNDVDGLIDRPGCFRDAGDVLDLREPRQGFRFNLRTRAPGNIVNDDWNTDGVGDFFVMLVDAFLGRTVVVRRDHQRAVRAGFLRGPS